MKLPKGAVWAFDRHVLSRHLGFRYRTGRLMMEALSVLDPLPRGVEVRRGTAGGRPARLFVPDGADPAPRVMWLHGGAYCFNSPRVYSGFIGHLALALGTSVLAPSYRRAPEHPYPAAPEDALAAFKSIAGAKPVILGGDSAGGGLALGTAMALRDSGAAAPAGLLLMSPWVDLTMSGGSIQANEGKDANLRAATLAPAARAYAGDVGLADPRVSPLHADLSDLPSTIVQCGGDELFLSEDTDLASRLEAAGTEVDLQVTDGMWHDFQAHAALLQESADALERMAAWAKPLLA